MMSACFVNASPLSTSELDFNDAFLASWAYDRLGRHENRLLYFLITHGADENDRSRIIHTITAQNGYAIQRRSGAIVGTWGLNGLSAPTHLEVLAAAREIWRANHQSSILHANHIEVVRNPGDADDIDDELVLGLGGISHAVINKATESFWTIVSDAFRSNSGIEASFSASPIAVASVAHDIPLYLLEPSQPLRAPHGTISATPASYIAELDQSGDLKPVLLAAAVAGETFTRDTLASILHIEPERLMPALDTAVAFDLIVPVPSSEEPYEFRFSNEQLHQAAYGKTPARKRLSLHRHAAASESRHGSSEDRSRRRPDRVARHHKSACDESQSTRWLSKAAWQAITQGDTCTAIAYLQEALATEAEPPNARATRRSILQLLGVQLAVARGSGADAVFETYVRSVELADDTVSLGWNQQFRSLWLAQTCHAVKGEVRAALTIGNLLLDQLNKRNKASESTLGRRILCQRVHALALMLNGQLLPALKLYGAVLEHYRSDLHAILRFAYGSDQQALTYAHLAWLHSVMADERARFSAERSALAAAERLQHPHTSAHVMGVLALASLSSGDVERAALLAQQSRTIATENNFDYWIPWSDVILGAAEAKYSPLNGYQSLKSALSRYRATDAAQFCPFIYAVLAETAIEFKAFDRAVDDAEAGLSLTKLNGCILYRPVLQHQRARALFALGRLDEANAALDAGYNEARRFGARKFLDDITRDGMRLAQGRDQILWQSRYHKELLENA